MKRNRGRWSIPLLLALILLLAACGSGEPEEETEPDPTEEAREETGDEEDDEEPVYIGVLSEDLYDFQIKLNSVVYPLPVPVSLFDANGWVYSGDLEDTLDPGGYTISAPMTKDDQSILVVLLNPFDLEQTLEDCYVCVVTADQYGANEGLQAVLPGDITIGSTYDEVVEAYGDPETENEVGSGIYLYYRDDESEVQIIVDNESRLVREITVQNMQIDEEILNGGFEVPDSVTDYVPPMSLGTRWDNFRIELDGVIYGLPAPTAYFLQNGWSFEKDYVIETLSPSRSSVLTTMRLDDASVLTYATNYAEEDQPFTNSFVNQITYDAADGELDVTLPGDITVGTTAEEVQSVWGKPDATEEGDGVTTYIYGTNVSQRVCLSFDEADALFAFQINYNVRSLDD